MARPLQLPPSELPALPDPELVEGLGLFVRRLNDESRNGAFVVVEGPHDAEALRSLGYEGAAFLLSHYNTLDKLVRMGIRYRKAILLLDLDGQGRRLTKQAAQALQRKRVRVDLFFRQELRRLTRGWLHHVEALGRYREFVAPGA
jgi:5S rRNA maturation endonuclease (ribonuclease M5)